MIHILTCIRFSSKSWIIHPFVYIYYLLLIHLLIETWLVLLLDSCLWCDYGMCSSYQLLVPLSNGVARTRTQTLSFWEIIKLIYFSRFIYLLCMQHFSYMFACMIEEDVVAGNWTQISEPSALSLSFISVFRTFLVEMENFNMFFCLSL